MDKVEQFKELVDAMHKSSRPQDIFKQIADLLMNEVCILAGTTKYRIMDCEFYYHHPTSHSDPYVHAVDKKENTYSFVKQGTTGQWYYHDFGDGIDITIGNGEHKIYGGILIRGISRINNNSSVYYPGPFIALREIMNCIGAIDAGGLSLVAYSDYENKEVVSYLRALGKLKNDDNFYHREYRFIIPEKDYIKSIRNSKPAKQNNQLTP